ncbi:MAG: DegT/DnrJ/EryC1/StrS family aminotransferase [Phycisphaerales bacterium JB037]
MPDSSVAPAAKPSDLAANGGSPCCASPVPFMSLALSEADIAAANEVLRSGMLRQGPKCAELEQRFRDETDAAHAFTCANGTCALQLAYGGLLKRGDKVLAPAWTYIATVSMLVAEGTRPILVDCLEDTFQIDIEDAERRLEPGTTAIACTHLYGMPVDIEAVEDFAKRKGLKVIYDAAQAHLATYRGQGLGAFGDAVTYSFYATKNLGTGEGGMITTNDDALASKIAALRSHGETDKYLHTSIGFNYRMNDITAAIGCSRMDRLAEQTDARRAVADRYDAILGSIDGLHAPGRTPHAEPVWHLYTAKMDLDKFSCSRDQLCDALRAEGVPTAIHYPRALSRQPAFEGIVNDHPPVADSLSARVFSLPIHHDLTDAHLEGIEAALRKVARAFRA